MVHSLFSIVAPVAGRGPVSIREDDLAFDGLGMVHFASVVEFDGPAGGKQGEFPRYVVLESGIDGDVDDYLAALVFAPARRAAVADLFAGCEGFDTVRRHPPASDAYRDALVAYLRAHVLQPELFHIGSPGLRVDQITAGAALRCALDDAVTKSMPAGLASEPPLQIAQWLRRFLRVPVTAKTHWHLDPKSARPGEYAWFSDPVSPWPSRLRDWGKLALVAAPVFALIIAGLYWLWMAGGWRAVAAALVILAAAAWLLWKWLQGRHAPTTVDVDALHALTEQEDHGVHNHMASLALLKPGLLRRISIRAVLGTLNLVYRTFFTDVTPGKLMGLPTIHFAQWSIVRLPDDAEGRRREALMFLSNYDGSWESYLDDFLEFLFEGVVAIWANAVTFPSPLDGRIFKSWARTRMAPFAVWHDKVYPELTVSNIQNNNRLRLGLFEPPRTDHEARLWLARLGAIKRGDEQFDDVAGPLPAHDMQGLVLRGYGTLPYAAYALLRLDDGEAARRWLQGLVGSITDGRELEKRDRARETEAVNVAFTHKALEVLGLPAPIRDRFPLAFREGIAPGDGQNGGLQHRSRILGDVGGCAPEHWDWGGRAREGQADVLLMMYARTAGALAAVRRRHLDAFRDAGAGGQIDIILSEPTTGGVPHGKTIEHFGFLDGLSQPKIEGTWQAGRDDGPGSPADLMKPGEFILGYQSGDGSTTPGVPVEAALDPDALLPLVPGSSDLHDFGRNGTFLVARQLAQHVAEFRRFTAQAAGVAASQYATRAAETVGARVVGRWPSGAPLVEAVGTGDPNAFSFGTDPHGFGCPIGAHIRRANPRDSLGAGGAAAQAAANRHRLLRRGRPYGPPLPPGELEEDNARRGMMFVCLNADIERQFEFVQQNWINNPTFGGLYAERDPLVGAISPPAHLTIQANAVCQRIDGLSRFVSVVGGGYYFMPGMSALRYLARLEPGRTPHLAAEPRLPLLSPPHQSPLRSALAMLARALPWVGLLWAIRFPLLLAVLLVLLPFTAAWLPAMALPLFLTSVFGAALIAFLASTAAWAAMVMLRLVLMYGTRVGLARPKWTGSAKWGQVLAFQALALPIVVASIHYTARDLTDAGVAGSYQDVATRLALAAAAGLALGILALGVATAIQSLRPGSRPDLFAPPFPILTRIIRRVSRVRLVHRVTRRISSLSESIVGSVPEAIGDGYIDYRRRRLLPGHAFAAVLAGLVFLVYVTGLFLLDPSRRGPVPEVPAVAYVLFMLIAIGWLLSAASFFLDRYRIPTVLTGVVWLIAVATLARTDHIFEVGDPIEPAASPAQVATAAQKKRPGPVIVVASEGYGLASSAWTAEVLTRLAGEPDGRRFADAVRLISASSGATLGTTHFVDAYTDQGFGGAGAPSLQDIRARARAASSAEGWWGLVYPDLVRAFVPVLVPARADRGWAIEQAWRRPFPDRRGPTLSAWRRDVAAGWRPATVFGVTGAETGEQGLLASYRVREGNPNGPDFVTRDRDVAVITAARLSAGFPYVSPVPRPGTDDRQAYHFTDGGFWDNSGVLPALQWIEDAGSIGNILLIEVRSAPRRTRNLPESMPWTLEVFGPLRTLLTVRYNGHAARTEDALRQFMRTHPVDSVVFELNDTRVPFTWNLGRAHFRHIEDAWTRGDNRIQREKVRAFLAAQ